VFFFCIFGGLTAAEGWLIFQLSNGTELGVQILENKNE